MSTLELLFIIFMVAGGVPNKIIDNKHRKRKAYEPGNAWAYYSKLSKEGNWEGKFIIWSGYFGIGLIIALFVDMFYTLSK